VSVWVTLTQSWLPLLYAKPEATFPDAEHHRHLTGTKLYCFATEAHLCVC